MIPELGQVALALSFCLAVAIVWFGLAGAALEIAAVARDGGRR
jgi:hypothetical protein